MGRQERKRWDGNDRAIKLIKQSESSTLLPEEVEELRQSYTGYGGLHSTTWGQFFTPQVVTRFVVDMLNIGPYAKILEPSCGAGAFFAELPSSGDITGAEMMHEAAQVSKILYPHVQVRQGNTLTMLNELEDQFDLVIGNPPFCSIPKYEDYSGFTIAQKGKDRAEWYFLELGIRALKPGGMLAYIVPDGILGNQKDLPLRKWLFDQGYVRAVISLPGETFKMSGTGVKTSVLVIQKKIHGHEPGNYPVFMAVSNDIGWDSRGRMTSKCDLPDILSAWQSFRLENEYLFTPQPSVQEPSLNLGMPSQPQEPLSPAITCWEQTVLFS